MRPSCGHLKAILGASWVRLRGILGSLCASWVAWERLGPFWVCLGVSWAVLGCLEVVLGSFGDVLGASWPVLGSSWDDKKHRFSKCFSRFFSSSCCLPKLHYDQKLQCCQRTQESANRASQNCNLNCVRSARSLLASRPPVLDLCLSLVQKTNSTRSQLAERRCKATQVLCTCPYKNQSNLRQVVANSETSWSIVIM